MHIRRVGVVDVEVQPIATTSWCGHRLERGVRIDGHITLAELGGVPHTAVHLRQAHLRQRRWFHEERSTCSQLWTDAPRQG
jgi:hypothetical protein